MSAEATNPDGTIRLHVRLFKYRQSGISKIVGLHDGGSGALGKFIGTYKKETAAIRAPGQEHPVIVVYDNDSGAKSIRNAVRQASRKIPDGEYWRVIRNLYVVPTPLLNGATESKIEDFFDETTKQSIISGKTFNEENGFDTTNHYGKKVFAHRVVKPNADSISFEGFRPLLNTLTSVIGAHAAAVAEAKANGAIAAED